MVAPTQDHRDLTYVHDAEIAKEIRALTDGVGVDVALEMRGSNAALNTAIAVRAPRRRTSSSSA